MVLRHLAGGIDAGEIAVLVTQQAEHDGDAFRQIDVIVGPEGAVQIAVDVAGGDSGST